jgi:hypothetical protein
MCGARRAGRLGCRARLGSHPLLPQRQASSGAHHYSGPSFGPFRRSIAAPLSPLRRCPLGAERHVKPPQADVLQPWNHAIPPYLHPAGTSPHCCCHSAPCCIWSSPTSISSQKLTSSATTAGLVGRGPALLSLKWEHLVCFSTWHSVTATPSTFWEGGCSFQGDPSTCPPSRPSRPSCPDFSLDYYTQVQDLSYLVRAMGKDRFGARHR